MKHLRRRLPRLSEGLLVYAGRPKHDKVGLDLVHDVQGHVVEPQFEGHLPAGGQLHARVGLRGQGTRFTQEVFGVESFFHHLQIAGEESVEATLDGIHRLFQFPDRQLCRGRGVQGRFDDKLEHDRYRHLSDLLVQRGIVAVFGNIAFAWYHERIHTVAGY